MALLEGTVMTSPAGCINVLTDDGEKVIPVFPDPQVTVDGDGFIYKGSRYGDGTAISLAGGMGDSYPDMPSVCVSPGSPVFWVNQDV